MCNLLYKCLKISNNIGIIYMSYHTRSRASVPARHHGKACACDHITDFIAMHCSALRLDPPSTHDQPMYIAARAHALAETPFLSLFTPILHSPRGVWAECWLIGVCMAMHDVAGLYRAEIDKRATKPLIPISQIKLRSAQQIGKVCTMFVSVPKIIITWTTFRSHREIRPRVASEIQESSHCFTVVWCAALLSYSGEHSVGWQREVIRFSISHSKSLQDFNRILELRQQEEASGAVSADFHARKEARWC
jgi:hypothetical protein